MGHRNRGDRCCRTEPSSNLADEGVLWVTACRTLTRDAVMFCAWMHKARVPARVGYADPVVDVWRPCRGASSP